MTLLITGGAGFIGSNFIHYWLKKHSTDKIINLDALTYAGNLDNLKSIENNKNYKFIHGNICDKNLVNKIMPHVDMVIHFAAESHVDRSIENADEFINTNIIGTHTLLEAARNNDIKKFHHISTDEVFGSLKLNDFAFNENNSYDPHSPYSAAKASSDHLVRAYFHTYNLPITISNCSNNYGPYQFPEKLIPLFITNLLENKKVPVYGAGQNIRDWIHVDDHNQGIEFILAKGKIGETYCLGGANETTNLDLTYKILKLLNKNNNYIEYVEDRKSHDLRYAIDFSKAKQELDWEPQINFETGLLQTINWYKNNINWWKKLKK